MSESLEPTRIEMSPRAVSALRARGGSLYVWRDKAGMIRARAKPPVEALSYDTFSGDGWCVRVERGIFLRSDGEIDPAVRWVITWSWLPWPHFRALYDSADPGTVDRVVDGILDGILKPWLG